MSEYQKTKNNPYLLPKTLYYRVLWLIRDYERLKAERNEIIYSYNCQQDGLPKGSTMDSPTEQRALKLERLSRELEAIDQALLQVDLDMRNSILENIYYQIPYPHYPIRWTWQRQKQKFVYNVAKNLHFL